MNFHLYIFKHIKITESMYATTKNCCTLKIYCTLITIFMSMEMLLYDKVILIIGDT